MPGEPPACGAAAQAGMARRAVVGRGGIAPGDAGGERGGDHERHGRFARDVGDVVTPADGWRREGGRDTGGRKVGAEHDAAEGLVVEERAAVVRCSARVRRVLRQAVGGRAARARRQPRKSACVPWSTKVDARIAARWVSRARLCSSCPGPDALRLVRRGRCRCDRSPRSRGEALALAALPAVEASSGGHRCAPRTSSMGSPS